MNSIVGHGFRLVGAVLAAGALGAQAESVSIYNANAIEYEAYDNYSAGVTVNGNTAIPADWRTAGTAGAWTSASIDEDGYLWLYDGGLYTDDVLADATVTITLGGGGGSVSFTGIPDNWTGNKWGYQYAGKPAGGAGATVAALAAKAADEDLSMRVTIAYTEDLVPAFGSTPIAAKA